MKIIIFEQHFSEVFCWRVLRPRPRKALQPRDRHAFSHGKTHIWHVNFSKTEPRTILRESCYVMVFALGIERPLIIQKPPLGVPGRSRAGVQVIQNSNWPGFCIICCNLLSRICCSLLPRKRKHKIQNSKNALCQRKQKALQPGDCPAYSYEK